MVRTALILPGAPRITIIDAFLRVSEMVHQLSAAHFVYSILVPPNGTYRLSHDPVPKTFHLIIVTNAFTTMCVQVCLLRIYMITFHRLISTGLLQLPAA